MFASKEHYEPLRRDSDTISHQTGDIDDAPEDSLRSIYDARICYNSNNPTFIIVVIQGYWLYYLKYQLHPVHIYSSSRSSFMKTYLGSSL